MLRQTPIPQTNTSPGDWTLEHMDPEMTPFYGLLSRVEGGYHSGVKARTGELRIFPSGEFFNASRALIKFLLEG